MRRLLLPAALIVAFAPIVVAADVPAPFRALTFVQATEAAQAENKLVFVDFYTTWCEPCKRLDRDTFAKPEVAAALAAKTVAIKLDAEKNGLATARVFKVAAYPTLLIARPDGSEVDRIVGFLEPPAFLRELNRVVALAASGRTALDEARAVVAQQKPSADAGDEPVEAQPHFDLAKKLIAAGKHEEALNELLWCWDEGKKDPEFARIRSMSVPRELSRLAREYPAAREAMVARRDQARERALANKGGTTVVQDLIQLNRELKADDDTVAVFDQMPDGDRRKVTISIYLFDYFVEKQRYKDATMFKAADSSTMLIERAKKMPSGESSTESYRKHIIGSTAKRVEALAGSGEIEQARGLGEKLLTLDSSDETKAVLKQHAARAGQPDLFPF